MVSFRSQLISDANTWSTYSAGGLRLAQMQTNPALFDREVDTLLRAVSARSSIAFVRPVQPKEKARSHRANKQEASRFDILGSGTGIGTFTCPFGLLS